MNTFVVAVILALSALSVECAKKCSFPHKGDGGVLNKQLTFDINKIGYIPGSVLVWVDVARNAKAYVKSPKGLAVLDSWIDASKKFDKYMINKNIPKSYEMFQQAAKSFNDVAQYVNKKSLRNYFRRVYKEFKELIDLFQFPRINDYMINAYKLFKKHLGC